MRATLVLATLILGAIVANINLSVANVALPDIGRQMGASQVQLTMVASMFTMGLAASVLYLGAIGDSYGRKILLLAGAALSVPASLVAGFAPNIAVLIGARFVGGIAAGLMFPTTLSLISALWRGRAATRAIALWSGVGGGAAALGSVVAGLLLDGFWWGSVFLLTTPFALLVLIVGFLVVPWRAGEKRVPVDHVGGVLSVLAVAILVITIQKLPDGLTARMGIQLAVSAVLFVFFFWRQRRAPRPLIDLKAARAPTFWVAAVAGTITFGSLIGAVFLGQQFTQNVLGYGAFEAALVSLPAPALMMVFSVVAGRMVPRFGSRVTFSQGLIVVALGFAAMLGFWNEGAGLFAITASYGLLGIGVGLAMTASSYTLMASLPTTRAGMGSAVTDLTRDFGGAILQALMGTVLTIVYAQSLIRVFHKLTPEEASQLGDSAARQIISSYEGAEQVAASYPQAEAQELMQAVSKAFTEGKSAAYLLALGLTIAALILMIWKYPKKEAEQAFFAEIVEVNRREQERATLGE